MKIKAALTGLFACAASLTLAASNNWATHVVRKNGAHTIGKPEAEQTLTEFVSYTCSHCGEFARVGDEALKLALIGPGKMKLEIRHIVRDPIDLTAALLTWCGEPEKFPRNHAAFMFAQPDFLGKAGSTTAAQRQRWTSGPLPTRFRAIASDLDFYELMERRGYSRPAVDQCLANETLARSMANRSQADGAEFNIPGTPSFALDGEMLQGVHSWPTLERRLTRPSEASGNTE